MEKNNTWELSEEQKAKCEQERVRFAVQHLNETEKLEQYNMYVADLKKGFIEVMNFVNAKINDLIEIGKISDFTEIRARIKAAKSAIKNDNTKALDDIFGIEIITATEEEIEIISNNLRPYMKTTKSKKHNKLNGYKAQHKYCYFKKDKLEHLKKMSDVDQMPIIEIQLKTSEVYIKSNGGMADHTTYKGEDKSEIQRKFDNNEFSIYTNIPIMWTSRNRQMVILSPEETLKKIYPFLNTKKKRSR